MKALVFVFVAALCGCGAKAKEAAPAAPAAPAATPLVAEQGDPPPQSPCTQLGCDLKCGVNLCVGWKQNSTGGCNYYCLKSTFSGELALK